LVDDPWKARRRPKTPEFQAAEIEPDGPVFEFELLDDSPPARHDESGMELGPDLVLFFSNKIVVCSPKQMYDWEAKNFEKPKIVVRNKAYYLTRLLPGDEERPYRYELAEWPDYLQAEPNYVIDYDENYVNQRDGRFKKVKSKTGKTSRLTFLYPFLGFAWSGFKKKFLEPHGFNPLRISLFSCVLAYVIFMAELISFFFFASGVLQWSIGNGMLWLDYTCLLVLPVDAAVRFFQIVNGTDRYPDGFLEWIPNFFLKNRPVRVAADEGDEDFD
jgi:hypothetical protein